MYFDQRLDFQDCSLKSANIPFVLTSFGMLPGILQCDLLSPTFFIP